MEIESLREREKELLCLYKVQQITLNSSRTLEEVFHDVVEALGPGWQRPAFTGGCLEYFGRRYPSSKYRADCPHLSQALRLGNQIVGSITVSDASPGFEPDAPDVFLEEERILLKNIASLLSNFLEWRHLEVLGKRLASTEQSHWRWRENIVMSMIQRFDGSRFGPTDFYLGGSTESGQATHGSDIDLYLYHQGSQSQKDELEIWLEGWSVCIAEMARVQTGEHFPDGILSIRWLAQPPDSRQTPPLREIGKVSSSQPKSSKPEPQLRASNAETEAMVQRTLLGLSHELRNPLTVIATNLSLLKQNLSGKMRKETVSDAEQAVANMNHLVTDLMLFLRAETGVEKPLLEDINLQRFVTSTLSRIRQKHPEFKITLSEPEARVDSQVRLNRKITERILLELITNSNRYSKADETKVSIIPIDENRIALSISDEGDGIDSIHHDKLFEQFYRIESSREKKLGGVGLGLPLAKALAKSQHSLLTLSSKPGEGTDVRIVFQRTS